MADTKMNWWEAAPQPLPLPMVYVQEEPRKTGLFDQNGNPIVRKPEPIGFLAGVKSALRKGE